MKLLATQDTNVDAFMAMAGEMDANNDMAIDEQEFVDMMEVTEEDLREFWADNEHDMNDDGTWGIIEAGSAWQEWTGDSLVDELVDWTDEDLVSAMEAIYHHASMANLEEEVSVEELDNVLRSFGEDTWSADEVMAAFDWDTSGTLNWDECLAAIEAWNDHYVAMGFDNAIMGLIPEGDDDDCDSDDEGEWDY